MPSEAIQNQLVAEIVSLSMRDGMTGLFNHRHFMEVLKKEAARAMRYDRSLCLIMMDVDHFKQFNDVYGHKVGDQVLRTIASRLANITGGAKTFRYGGEEFAIILPETEMKGVVVLAERLRKQIEAMLLDVDGEKVAVTASFGVTIWEHGKADTDKTRIINAADKALYQSKRKERNTISFIGLSAVTVK